MNRERLYELLAQLLAAALVCIIPLLWTGRALIHAQPAPLIAAVLFASAYLIAAISLHIGTRHGARVGLGRVLVGGLAAFGLAFMALAYCEWHMPSHFATLQRQIPFTATAVGLLCLVAIFCVRGGWLWKLPVLIVAVVAGVLGSQILAGLKLKSKHPPPVAYLDTSLYVVKATTYLNSIDDDETRGGAIVAMDDGFLLAGGDGGLFFIKQSRDEKSLERRKLAYRVPINPKEFDRDARAIVGQSWASGTFYYSLRVADILLQTLPDGSLRLFASHQIWNEQEKCFAVRVSLLQGTHEQLLDPAGSLKWRTVYESSPCLELNTKGRGLPFGGIQLGGVMGLLGENELLLAIGDHEFDGWNRTPALPQDPASPYGKMHLIHLDTGQSELYSTGLRDPEGLYVDPSGNVWSTEHGPRGGDELNHIQRGMNYGWPKVTFGTEYRLHYWPLSESQARHEGFEKPVVAFVPSIAASAVIGIEGSLFAQWRGDLLVTALSGQMRRVRIEDGRAIVVEPINVDKRVRDVAQGQDGKLALWTDTNALIFLEPAPTGDAESLIMQCSACHTLSDWEKHSVGPNLWRVMDRRVASQAGFEYSKAMQEFGGRWTRERLDRFLASPNETVPGTNMQYPGMPDAEQRKKVIDYLAKLH